ncbi:MAG: PhzF family phenazine biosynthesis protein [Cyanobacteria bacterium P01_H01_bin.119]
MPLNRSEPLDILQVDAFTEVPFRGNPAAVCVLPKALNETWMQAIAAEMNLSETAFLVPTDDGYHLRWFTPAAEVDLCGHATLASAHVLWSEGYLDAAQPARFQTKSGLLTATLHNGWITLNFPAQPVEPLTPPAALIQVLRGLNPVFVGVNPTGYFVELETATQVRSLQPDFALLKTLPVQGLIVTSRADSSGPYHRDGLEQAAEPHIENSNPGSFDFVSRYFAPAVGIDEDPVTGSAHCGLTPYWQKKLGKPALMAQQVSARSGVLKVTTEGDRVLISGQAVTVLRGKLIS